MTLRAVTLALAAMAVSLTSTCAFAPMKNNAKIAVSTTPRSSTELEMNKGGIVGAVATACLVANVLTADPAMAMQPTNDFGSTQVVAARSGGRMGGRARMSAPSRSYRPSSTNTYRSTTIVRPMIAPPVVVSPFGGGYGYGYNPMGGFGLGYGLGALNNAGNSVTDYRQEGEIQRTEAELQEAQKKNVELEQRIKALEQQGAVAGKQ